MVALKPAKNAEASGARIRSMNAVVALKRG